MQTPTINSGKLLAGVARVDITQRESTETTDPLYAAIDSSIVNDPLYVKALVLKNDEIALVIITVDAVAIAEIGTIGNGYLSRRAK